MLEVPFTSLLSGIVDNRGRTAPTADAGTPLIATNCIKESALYPVFENVRYVDDEAMRTWFRGHPEPGDILFVCKGSPGRVALVPDPVSFCIAQDMVSVRPDSAKVYPKYLFAALRSRIVRSRIDNMHVGSLIPHFKKGDFDKLLIPLPDSASQRQIGDLYFVLSDKIESNRCAIDIAESLADTTFATAASTSVALDDVAILTMGNSPSGDTYNDSGDGMPFYQGVRDFGRRYPRYRVWTTDPIRTAEEDDTLISVRAPVGELNRARDLCCIGRGVGSVRSKFSSTIYYALRASRSLWEPFQHEGTVFGSISKADLSHARLPWPSERHAAELETKLGAIDSKIRSLSLEIEKTTALRDALLVHSLSGRIRASEAQEVVA